MPFTNILESCNHSVAGIKNFKLATRDTDGNALTFPLDVVFKSGSTNTIKVSEDFENRILTINNTQVSYRYIYPETCSYNEEEVETRQGRYYQKTLTFTLPKVNLTTNNQLRDFLFTTSDKFAISNAFLFFTDVNNQNWIGNYNVPFVLENFDLTTGSRTEQNNRYNLEYICRDYYRALKYEVI